MRIDPLLTDDAVLAELGLRLRRARLARNVTRAALAEEAGVGERTIARVEAGESTTLVNLVRLLRPLGLLDNLDALLPSAPVDPFAGLGQTGRERQRASRSGAASPPRGGWVWGDEVPGPEAQDDGA